MLKVAFAVALMMAVISYRFFGLNLSAATWLQHYFAYWSILIVLAWFVVSLKQELFPYGFTSRRIGEILRGHVIGITFILICGVFLQIQEPHMLKVLQDEPTHVATSFLMHNERVTATPAETQIFDGKLVYLHTVPAVRMVLFSTLLSFLHDVTGYRVENVFILNAVLGALVLGLLYVGGNILAGKNGGYLAVFLMAGLPLLAQIATSGSYDLLNLALLLGLFLATRIYLLCPGLAGLNLMLSVGVLLALSRYESILYLLIPIGAILYKWKQERKVALTWSAMLSPLAVWPCFTANFIILSNDAYLGSNLRGKGEGLFGLQYLSNNARQAVYYLFNFDLDATNSILISILGSLALIALWISCVIRFRDKKGMSFEARLLGVGAALVFGMYVLILTHFWGMPTQSSATRFIIPLCAIMVLSGVWLVKELSAQKKLTWVPVAVAALFMFTIANSSNARASTTIDMSLPLNYKWFLEYARKHDTGRTLYVANSSLYMLIYGYPSTPTSVFNQKISGAILCLKAKLYDEILIMDIRYRDPVSGSYTNGVAVGVSPEGQYEVMAERSFPYGQVARILRLKPDFPTQDGTGKKLQPPAVLKETFKSEQERSLYYFNLLP